LRVARRGVSESKNRTTCLFSCCHVGGLLVISGVQQCGRSVLGRSKKLGLLSCLTGAEGNIRLRRSQWCFRRCSYQLVGCGDSGCSWYPSETVTFRNLTMMCPYVTDCAGRHSAVCNGVWIAFLSRLMGLQNGDDQLEFVDDQLEFVGVSLSSNSAPG